MVSMTMRFPVRARIVPQPFAHLNFLSVAVMRVVSAILHLGNIEFQEKTSDQAIIADDTAVQKVFASFDRIS